MQMEDFDRIARQSLDNHPSPVDTDRLWANIDATLRPRRRKRAAWRFWAFLFAFCLTGGGVFYFLSKNKSLQLSEKETVGMSAPVLKPMPENAPPGNQKTNPPGFKNGKNERSAPKSFQRGMVARPKLSESFETFGKLEHGTNAGAESAGKTRAKRAVSDRRQAGPALEAGGRVVAAAEDPIFPYNSTPTPSTGANQSTQENILNDLKSYGYESIGYQIAVDLLRPAIGRAVSFLPQSPYRALELPKQSVRFDPALRNLSKPLRERFATPYIGFYGGAIYPFKTLESQHAEWETLLKSRNRTETVLEGFNLGFFAGARLFGRLSVDAGASYTRLNERFEWRKTRFDTLGEVPYFNVIINGPGDSTLVQAFGLSIRKTERTKQSYNHYDFIDLPVGIGWELNRRGPWKAYAKVGVVVNLSLRYKVEMLNRALAPVRYESGVTPTAEAPFRAEIGLSPFGAVGVRRQLGFMDVFGEMRYTQHLRPVGAALYPLRQQYRLPGINVGIKINILR
jgi:hypothetical protein